MRIAAAVGLCLTTAVAGAQSVAVRGTVRDSATGQPMAGAIVSVLSGSKLISVRTDEAGAFAIPGVNAASTTLYARRLGYARGEWPVTLQRDTIVSLLLRPTARALAPVRVGAKGEGIWGVIGRADDLKPIAGAKVFVVGSETTVATDSAGEFFVPLKKPGTYMVRVTSKGYGEEVLPVIVKANQVVESSQLLEVSNRGALPLGAWMDLDSRLRWAPNASAFVTGSELRERGAMIRDALAASPTFVSKTLRLVPSSVCLFVNGAPKPGMPMDAINVENVRAVEVYVSSRELARTWPSGGLCSDGLPATENRSRGNHFEPPTVKWVVIWTR